MNRDTYFDRESLIITDLVEHLITENIDEHDAWDSTRYTVVDYWYLFDDASESDIISHTLPYAHRVRMDDVLRQSNHQPEETVDILARESVIERIYAIVEENYSVIEEIQFLHDRLDTLVDAPESRFEYVFGYEPDHITPSTLTDAFYTWNGMVSEYGSDHPQFPFDTAEDAESATSVSLPQFNEAHVRRLDALMPNIEYQTGTANVTFSLTTAHMALKAWLNDQHDEYE